MPIFNNVIVAGDAVLFIFIFIWFVVKIYGDVFVGVAVVVWEINSNGRHCAAPSIYIFIIISSGNSHCI